MAPTTRNNWIAIIGLLVSMASILLLAGRGLQRAEFACLTSSFNAVRTTDNAKILASHISANAVSDAATMRELTDIKDMLREMRQDIKGISP